jgi:regulator of PEP synthase PpsR (kinase-PPPase family)
MEKDHIFYIYAISDSKGLTVEMAANVAAAQFRDVKTEVVLIPNIETTKQIDEVLEEARSRKGIIIHSFVKHELADYIWYEGRLSNVEVVNLLGPVLNRMSNHLHRVPVEKPGLFSELNKDYFRRIETTEFAIKHDDGAFVEDLDQAEIVLLGVSRTFKTPLSIYLSYKGWFVANIPIVLDMPLPEILYSLPPERIFCLVTNPTNLSKLRNVRNEYLKGLVPTYASYEHVRKELRYANYLYSIHPDWSVVKVTAKPIEEIASNIIRIYRRKKREREFGENPEENNE